MKRKLTFLIIIAALISSWIGFSSKLNLIGITAKSSPIFPPLIQSSFLEINSDDDFITHGFSGDGTVANPFLIRDLIIDTTDDIGINILNTTKHFIIHNCRINGTIIGIQIQDVYSNTAQLLNNICVNNSLTGIVVRRSPQSTISNNTCSDGHNGIFIDDSTESKIEKNLCERNYQIGIYVEQSRDAEIKDNVCKRNFHRAGIYITDSSGVLVSNNTCKDNWYVNIIIYDSTGAKIYFNNVTAKDLDGTCISISHSSSSKMINNTCLSFFDDHTLNVYHSQYSLIANNSLFGQGLKLHEDYSEDYQTYEVNGNKVNNKQLGFFKYIEDREFAEPTYGQFILILCSRITLSNQNHEVGLKGIKLYLCEEIVISNNKLSKNTKGMEIDESEKIDIIENQCSNGAFGIQVGTGCTNILLKSNICENNFLDGIFLSECDNVYILNNTCKYNGRAGIFTEKADYNTITYNLLEENGYSFIGFYGIALTRNSDYNVVHHNSFINNNGTGTQQAYDNGQSNLWYDTETREGNFWSDYTGEEMYYIDGNANSADVFPLEKQPSYIELIRDPRKNLYALFILYPITIYSLLIIFRKRKKNR